MKKITFFLSFFAFATMANAQIFKRELKKHTSEPGYFWFKPVVDVDTSTLEDGVNANTLFLVEGYLTNGTPIEVFVEGKTLRFLLQLPAKQNTASSGQLEGFMFTVKSLGQSSFLTKSSIKKGRYYEKQKERLLRERNTEKYELWSEAPKKVKGKVSGSKIIPEAENPVEGSSNEKRNWGGS